MSTPIDWVRTKDPEQYTATFRHTFAEPVPPSWRESKPAVGVERWYDVHTRCWVTYLVDEHGYQTGESDYTYGKLTAAEFSAIVAYLVDRYSA